MNTTPDRIICFKCNGLHERGAECTQPRVKWVDEQAAFARGEAIECAHFNSDGQRGRWHDCPAPEWREDGYIAYRVKPEEKAPPVQSETAVFELTDVTDEEMYYPIGIWLTLGEAIAYVDRCKEPDDLGSDQCHDDTCRVEIRERKIGRSTHGKAVFERQWVQDYNDADDKYEWRIVPTTQTP